MNFVVDKIIIKGLKVFSYHGVNPEEKVDGQMFILDIIAHTSLEKAGETDNLGDTVSYSKILKTAVRVMNENKYDLLEKAAHRVAMQILEEFKDIDVVDVCLKKPQAPIKADFDYVGVEISRSRRGSQ